MTRSTYRCFVCGKGLEHGIALYRENEKGKTPIWACSIHRTNPVDPIVDELTSVIEGAQHGRH